MLNDRRVSLPHLNGVLSRWGETKVLAIDPYVCFSYVCFTLLSGWKRKLVKVGKDQSVSSALSKSAGDLFNSGDRVVRNQSALGGEPSRQQQGQRPERGLLMR